MTVDGTSFKEAYGVLQGHAETLRVQNEPNIDDLLSIVEESVAAYKVCKERIDAVEKALQKALTDVGGDAAPTLRASDKEPSPRGQAPRPTATRPAAVPRQQPNSGFEDMDDDIPF
jgi:exodeoxyribonuclease VII small subunit